MRNKVLALLAVAAMIQPMAAYSYVYNTSSDWISSIGIQLETPGTRTPGEFDFRVPGRKSPYNTRDYAGQTMVRAAMRKAELSGANFENAILSQGRLKKANFSGANFHHASLLGADLRKANFDGSNLQGADLRGANIKGASFEGALFDRFTLFPHGFIPAHHGMLQAD